MAHGMVIGRSGDLWTNLSAAARSRVRAKRYSVTVTRASRFHRTHFFRKSMDSEWRPNPEGDLDGQRAIPAQYSSGVQTICCLDTLRNEALPRTDATLTIRIIKSFTFRTEKSLVLQHLNLEELTVGELKDIARKGY